MLLSAMRAFLCGGWREMKAYLLIAALLIPSVCVGWEHDKVRDGVTLSRQNSVHSTADALKARVTIPRNADDLASILTDLSQHQYFVPHMKDIQLLSRRTDSAGKTISLLHQTTSLPVISDRDVVIRTKTWREVKGRNVKWVSTFRAVKNEGPPVREGIVRMPYMVGAWSIRSTDDGAKSVVTYLTTAEVGGMVPEAIADLSKGDALIDLLHNFRSYALEQIPAP